MDTLCLAGRSALEFWFRESLPVGLSLKPMEPVLNRLDAMGFLLAAPMLALPEVAPSDERVNDLLQGPLRGFRLPLDLLVMTRGSRRQSRLKKCHVWGGPIPSGSVVKVGEGFSVCTPEFAFYQVAASASLGSAAILAHELCAGYVRSTVDSRGFRTCSPLSTPDLIDGYLVRLGGTSQALRRYHALLKRVRCGAASPMETILTTRLALPRTSGGYGAICDELNGRIELPPLRTDGASRSRVYYGDLVWHQKRLVVEYDSEQFHTGARRIDEDARRRNDIQDNGYTVVTVTKQQMYDEAAFHRVATQITNGLGLRFQQKRCKFDWEARRASLATELLQPREFWSTLF